MTKLKLEFSAKKVEEGTETEMSSYKIKQMIASLSEKADDAKTEVLSGKADEPIEDYIKTEEFDKNYDKEASEENDGDDELMPIRLIIALKNIGYENQTKSEDCGVQI